MKIDIAVVKREDQRDLWSVEMIDHEGEGTCYVTVFYGPNSQSRAREYALFLFNTHTPTHESDTITLTI